VSTRREALYKTRGLDIERWVDLVSEAKSLKREINSIAKDYDTEQEKEKATRDHPDEKVEEEDLKRDEKVAKLSRKDKDDE
jgi:hypothetical protein